MADITITIPNTQLARVVTALCSVGGYVGDPSDQTARREFARGVLRDHVRQTVLRYEQQQAAAAAMAAVTVEPVTVD